MNITIDGEINRLAKNGYLIVAESLTTLRDFIKARRWDGVDLDNIGYVQNGIVLYVNYCHILFSITIKTIEQNSVAYDYVYRTNSVTLEARWSYGRPNYPITCLKSLLKEITMKYTNFNLFYSCISIKEASYKAIEIFFNLCDIAHRMRIVSNDELKEYVMANQLNTCKEIPSIDGDLPF